MRSTRAVLDVSELPTVVFGNRSLLWWGTLGFMAIEGMTLAIGVASYFYLRRNFEAWPPFGTPYPDITLPTVDVVLYLISLAPLYWLSCAARRLDPGKVRVGLVIATLFILTFCVLRGFEFAALNTKWDSDAYGSTLWLLLGMHATLLLVEAGEVIGMMLVFFIAPWSDKHFSDVVDMAFYWYFLIGAWIPLYLLVFLAPRVI